MGGMGSWPVVFWSSLSCLSGSLTTFRWLSKKFAGGFCRFAVRGWRFVFLEHTKKYKIRSLFCIFQKYKKRKQSCILKNTKNPTFLQNTKIKKTKTYNIQKIQSTYKIQIWKKDENTKQYDPQKIHKKYENTRPVKKIQKTYDPRETIPKKNLQRLPKRMRNQNFASFVFLTRRRGCLLILRPDCLCFYFATRQKDCKRAPKLLNNT